MPVDGWILGGQVQGLRVDDVTDACGQTHHGSSSKVDFVHEAFIDEYMMPNLTAYNETCANLCNAMFSYRMPGIRGQAKYADIMELVLYNSALSGISIDGMHYFYTNPLRRTYDHQMDITDQRTREPYVHCFCCPPNLVRTIAKVSGWAYSLPENGVAVNLYGGNTLKTRLLDGSAVQLRQETGYPWDGAVTITVESCKAASFEIMLRIPAWADRASIRVNGRVVGVEANPGTFTITERSWEAGDAVILDVLMEAAAMISLPGALLIPLRVVALPLPPDHVLQMLARSTINIRLKHSCLVFRQNHSMT